MMPRKLQYGKEFMRNGTPTSSSWNTALTKKTSTPAIPFETPKEIDG